MDPIGHGEALIFPMPASSASMLVFTLPASGALEVDLFDARGRHMATLASGTYAQGEHTLALNVTPALAQGFYVCRIRATGINQALQFLWME